MSTALAATIGTGNIVGVATGIYCGGPGAVFWMWLTAFFGMALKFCSATLAVHFRDESGEEIRGGPMYYIEKGFKQRYNWNFKWLAFFFALSTAIAAFGIGNIVQANSVADSFATLFSPESTENPFALELTVGLILAVLAAVVIIGGIKRIGKVAVFIVPFMSIVYVCGGLAVLLLHINQVPGILAHIVRSAFTGTAAKGGLFGSAVLLTIRHGVARGLFSNESGLGTAPMAHSVARTDQPVREGLVAMIGPFIDTLIICTITALVIIITQAHVTTDLDGAALTSAAFAKGLFGWGRLIVTFGMIFFAYSTVLGWYYYGEKGVEYIFGHRVIPAYKVLWILLIPVGAVAKLTICWRIADIFNALMALPNLIALICLSGVVWRLLKTYYADPLNFQPTGYPPPA